MRFESWSGGGAEREAVARRFESTVVARANFGEGEW